MSWTDRVIEPAQLGLHYGSAPKRARELGASPATSLLILHGATLLDSAGDVELWARFTGRDNGGNNECTQTT